MPLVFKKFPSSSFFSKSYVRPDPVILKCFSDESDKSLKNAIFSGELMSELCRDAAPLGDSRKRFFYEKKHLKRNLISHFDPEANFKLDQLW